MDFIQNNPTPENYLCNSKFFSGRRNLSFSIVVVSILNLFKESVEYNISSLLPKLNLKAVSGAAFCQARYKIKLDFFKDLNAILINFNNRNNASSWKGYRLIAGDGSTVSLPASPQIKEHFGVYSESEDGAKCSLAQLFMFFVSAPSRCWQVG